MKIPKHGGATEYSTHNAAMVERTLLLKSGVVFAVGTLKVDEDLCVEDLVAPPCFAVMSVNIILCYILYLIRQ
ncbi:hypothetical protein J6590_011141 [Homalodisca vitripennis]|nr:hypothetical protein J6590_011141 [Homalodisca vitripennis]